MTDIHTCSLYCDRPECVLAQRDELRAELERLRAQGPVAWLDEFGNTFPLAARKPPLGWMDDHKRGWVPLYRAAPPAQPAEAQQNPVAWRHSKTGRLSDLEEEVSLADGDEWAEPLYAAPVSQQEPSAWRQWSTKRHDWDYQTNRGDLRPDTHADPLFAAAAQPEATEQALQKIADFGQDQERPAPSQAKSLALLDLDSVEHMQGGANGPTIRLRGFINAQTGPTAPRFPGVRSGRLQPS